MSILRKIEQIMKSLHNSSRLAFPFPVEILSHRIFYEYIVALFLIHELSSYHPAVSDDIAVREMRREIGGCEIIEGTLWSEWYQI